MALPILFGALAGLQALTGGIRAITAGNALSDLHKQPFPLQSETPEQTQLRIEAMNRRNSGFTPEQKNAWEQKLNRSENTGYQRTMNVAPTQAAAVLAGNNYTNAGAINDFAAKDAEQQQRNFKTAGGFVAQLQQIANNNIATQQRNRLAAESALGGAVSNGINSAMGAGNTLIASYGFDKNNPSVPPVPTAQKPIQLPQFNQPTDWTNTGGYGSKQQDNFSIIPELYNGFLNRKPQIPNENYGG